MTAEKNATAKNTKKRSGIMENQGPVMEFGNIEQAYKYLNEWQTRLFLNDWVIKLSLVEPDELNDNEDGKTITVGINTFNFTENSSHIRLVKPNNNLIAQTVKFCHEKILIHELLHCNYSRLDAPYSHEGQYYEATEHALLEQTAKSFLMAKYNLPFEWFKNF